MEDNSSIVLQFNPTVYSLSKTNDWQAVKMTKANVPKAFFKGGNPTSLKLELLFDTYSTTPKGEPITRDRAPDWGSDALDVRKAYIDKLYALTRIDTNTKKNDKTGRPPQVVFSWGKNFEFHSVVKSLNVQFTMFASNGVPVRAKVNLALQECQDPDSAKPRQNPTSQGTWGHKVYTVKPGDTIDRIAYQEYQDSAKWRFIAECNNLDDPMDLRPGQLLAIEPYQL